MTRKNLSSRRQFLQTTGTLAATGVLLSAAQGVHAAGSDEIKVGLIGCGGPGIRRVLNAYKEAQDKKLCIAAGTQRRHQRGYLETMKRIHGGAIGDLVGGRCYWNQSTLWKVDRTPGMSDLEWQMRNWY